MDRQGVPADRGSLEAALVPEVDALVAEGAVAVTLVGSRARGCAGELSDIDLVAIGTGRTSTDVRGGVLLTRTWRSEAECRSGLITPDAAIFAIPSWRHAWILHDPTGLAAELQDEAMTWTWDDVEPGRSTWLAEEVTSYAEETIRAQAASQRRSARLVAACAGFVALRLSRAMAVHLRLLLDSENELWDEVADRMDDEWVAAFDDAVGRTPVGMERRADALLHLYCLTARRIDVHLGEEQRRTFLAISSVDRVAKDLDNRSRRGSHGCSPAGGRVDHDPRSGT